MKEITIEQSDLKRGLYLLEDDSKAPFGSARKMLNVMITDRGGIGVRPGTQLFGNYNSSTSPIRGLFNFKKSGGDSPILVKFYDDEFEFLHPTLETWARVKNGFTPDQEFGYTYTLVNSDNDDFMYFCNRFEEYQRWRGAYSYLTSALSGGETAIPVSSTLRAGIYLTETATANSATTVTVSTATWATDMWKNFYVYFPGTGKVRKITGNNGTVLTFDTLGSGPGNVAFQIRALAFPATGTVIYNGTAIAYTGIDTATSFTVASAHVAPINSPIAIVPDTYIAAPRGNRMDTLKGRPYVGRVRTAVSRDSAGAVQGSAQAGSVFVGKLLDPTTFTYSATRVAGEGDILNIAYGGGDITDVAAYENEIAIYKEDYIETVQYTEDTNDSAMRTPLKPGAGSIARVIRGSDDHYFMTKDKRYTSLTRVKAKDLKPSTENIGYKIKRLLDSYSHDEFNGIEFADRLISCHKSSEDSDHNDVVLVYNKQTKSFEGIWTIPANNFEQQNGKLYYGESLGANVWQMFTTRKSDVRDDDTVYPVTAEWQTNFFNVLPLKGNIQAVCAVALEGYIKGNTTFTFNLFKDFSDETCLSFTFGGTEEEFLSGASISSFLGSNPLGLNPLGSVDAPDSDGRRRFSFIVYFPWIYGQYFSTGIQSNGIDQDWEVTRVGLGLKESVSTRTSNTKVI